MPRARRRLASALLLMAAGLAPLIAVADPLDRPAADNPRAAQAALLAVTTAGRRVIAVGERGTIVYSDDGGVRWTQAAVPVSQSLTAVFFIDPRRGWAVGHGGVILRSDDAGTRWTKQRDGRRAIPVAAVADRASAEDDPDAPLFDVRFLDRDVGLACGAFGTLLKTTDGGENWRDARRFINNPSGRHLYGVAAFRDALYFVGEDGAVFRSGDGGDHFAADYAPRQGTFFGVVAGADRLVAFGVRGYAIRSADAGWSDRRHVASGDGMSATAAAVLKDGAILIADQAGAVRFSRDGGETFAGNGRRCLPSATAMVDVGDGALIVTAMDGVHKIKIADLVECARP